MPGDFDRRIQNSEIELVNEVWVVEEAGRVGLSLDEAQAKRLLGGARAMQEYQQREDSKKMTLQELVRNKIQDIKKERENVDSFIQAFDEAHALYVQFGKARQDEIFYIFDREKPHSIVDKVQNLKKRTLEEAGKYFTDLALKYRKILNKLGPEFPSERRIFIVLGIGDAARVVTASFKVTKTGEVDARYEDGKKIGKPRRDGTPGKETIIYKSRAFNLDSIFLTQQEASQSLPK